MNILPINQISNYSRKQISPNFKGLWGETDSKTWEKGYTDFSEEKMHYYPFLDETKEEIEKVVEQNHFVGAGPHSSAYPEYQYNYVTEVAVEPKLLIKKSEWNQYLNNKNTMQKKVLNLIEETMQRLKLEAKPYIKPTIIK